MTVLSIAFCCLSLYLFSKGRSLLRFSLDHFVVIHCIYCQKGVLYDGCLCSILLSFPVFSVRRASFTMVLCIAFCYQSLYLLSEYRSLWWFQLWHFVFIPCVNYHKSVLYVGSLYRILLSVPVFTVRRAFFVMVLSNHFVVRPCIYCKKCVLYDGSLYSILLSVHVFNLRRPFFMMVLSIAFCCLSLYLFSEVRLLWWFSL